MTFERDKTKPIFEDFVIAENGDWRLWFLVENLKCGKHSFRLERGDEPTASETYVVGFDVMSQKLILTAGWGRLSAERPDLASWFEQTAREQFPLCQSCNEGWKKQGCV